MKITLLALFILFIASFIGCSNSKNVAVIENNDSVEIHNMDKYSKEQASKAFMGMEFGMSIDEILDLGYISVKDTALWVIPIKNRNIGHCEFENAVIFVEDGKLYCVQFSSYIEEKDNAIKLLTETSDVFESKYGIPKIKSNLAKDSLEKEKTYTLYQWDIRHKQIKGTITKTKSFYSVYVSICDTIVRNRHDSIAMEYQSKDI